MNLKNEKGFNLVELLIVILILGILAGLVLPYTFKVVEKNRATAAVGILHTVAQAQRAYWIDYPGSEPIGTLTNDGNTADCGSLAVTSPDRLVACGYMGKRDWKTAADDNSYYSFKVCHKGEGGGCCADYTDLLACTRRIYTAPWPYSSWRYYIDEEFRCSVTGEGDPPPCPRFDSYE
jgi:prepilin-type N-terminal cleavage/methylation domain-containing protein